MKKPYLTPPSFEWVETYFSTLICVSSEPDIEVDINEFDYVDKSSDVFGS